MLAIMMAGGVYCPLNPSDPVDRLNTLIEDTKTRIVLTHTATISRFDDHILPSHALLVNMDDITINTSMNIFILSTIDVSSDDVAYVVHKLRQANTDSLNSTSKRRVMSQFSV